MIRILAFLLALTTAALAQEHKHGAEIITGDTGKFYEGWMRPDMPEYSCCNKNDCAPVSEVKRVGSQWAARRKSDGKWLVIPPEKVEENRDSPDGQSHMCSVGTTVLCFIAGAGG